MPPGMTAEFVLGEPGFHAVCEVAPSTVEDEQSFLLQQATPLVCPHSSHVIKNKFITHPSFLVATNDNSTGKLLPGQCLPSEDYICGLDRSLVCVPYLRKVIVVFPSKAVYKTKELQ